jgi:hypothetical protein
MASTYIPPGQPAQKRSGKGEHHMGLAHLKKGKKKGKGKKC